jgi:hypothetical protein
MVMVHEGGGMGSIRWLMMVHGRFEAAFGHETGLLTQEFARSARQTGARPRM